MFFESENCFIILPQFDGLIQRASEKVFLAMVTRPRHFPTLITITTATAIIITKDIIIVIIIVVIVVVIEPYEACDNFSVFSQFVDQCSS